MASKIVFSFVIAFAVFALGLADDEGFSRKDAISGLKGFGDGCPTKPTDKDIEELIDMEENPSETTKCFMLCLMNQLGVLNDKKKLDVEMVKSFAASMSEGQEKQLEEIGGKCNAAVTENKNDCQMAFEYNACVLKEMKAQNIEIPKLT